MNESYKKNVFPVILSGGVGTRLWPISRKHYPKQFLKLTSDLTMLQETVLRVRDFQQPIAICNQEHRFIMAEQLHEIELPPLDIILEPEGKNTAPAIALGALRAMEKHQDAVLLVLPADHHIQKIEVFLESVELAYKSAVEGDLVTFGIKPDYPETGYGYIKTKELTSSIHQIEQFVEKPSVEAATRFLEDGCYLWNSGMFMFAAETYLQQLEQFEPELYQAVLSSYRNSVRDLDFCRVDAEAFRSSPSISVDYAVMERTTRGKVAPVDIGWNDIGSFSSLYDVLEKDGNGNAIKGDVISHSSHNCLLHTENQLLTTIGLNNITVVATKDSLLVADKSYSQNVRDIVGELVKRDRQEYELHRDVHRPWGSFDSLIQEDSYLVKLIRIKPGQSISKQYHNHRAEHWFVIKGKAMVEVDGCKFVLHEKQSTFIEQGSIHRLANEYDVELLILEIQIGSYLDENDIVRLDDYYDRL